MKRNQTRRLTLAAMMGAVSFVLMYFSFSVPVLSPFASFDLSALPDLIGGFVLGPVGAVEIIAVKVLLKLVFKGGEPGSVDGINVKEACIQGVGLLGRAVIVFKNLANLVFGVFGELVERAITGTVVRKTIHVDPRAIDIAEQILRRAGHGGERCRVDARIQSGTHDFTLSIFGDKTVYPKRIIVIM